MKLFGVSHLFQKVLISVSDVCIILITTVDDGGGCKDSLEVSNNKLLHMEEDTWSCIILKLGSQLEGYQSCKCITE